MQLLLLLELFLEFGFLSWAEALIQEVVDLFDLTIAPFESDDFAQVFAENRLLDGKCHRLRGFFGTPCIDGSDGIQPEPPTAV